MNRKDAVKYIAALCCALFISGCFASAGVTEKKTEKNVKKPASIANIAYEKKTIVEGNNKFAVALFRQLRDKEKDSNFFFSPYSIYLAYSMLFEGAEGETAGELASVFGFSGNDDLRRESVKEELSKYQDKKQEYGIFIANSLWGNKDFTILQPYKNVLNDYYFAEIYDRTDFSKKSSADKVNKWTAKNTDNKIKKIIDGQLDASTAFVLVNTVYFKEKWEIAFDKNATENDDFYVPGQEKTTVKLMKQKDKYMYYENKDIQAVRMSYRNKSAKSMIAVLPKEGGVDSAEEFIFNNDVSFFLSNMTLQQGIIYFPKFEAKWNSDLAKIMASLGLVSSDYGNISPQASAVSSVLHSSFIKIDEEETEAAAATAVAVRMSMSMMREEPPFVFRADKPFVYMIIDEKDGKILFMGKMFKPEEAKGK